MCCIIVIVVIVKLLHRGNPLLFSKSEARSLTCIGVELLYTGPMA